MLGSLTLAATVGAVGVAPRDASATPAAAPAASVAAARPKATAAGKRTKASRRAKAGTRAKAVKAAKRSKTSPRATATRSRSVRGGMRGGIRSRRAERPAPRPSADLMSNSVPTVDEVAVPQVALPELSLAAAAPGTANPFAIITRSATSLLDGLVARARGQLGTRYVLGGADPDNALDCSSFARYVMEAMGVRLPRTANQQARTGTAVPRDLAALRPGDLLTFGSRRRTSHVGIYLGEGRFIHASVKSGQVIETTIERNRSLFRRWQGARRLLAGAPDAAPDSLAADESGGA